jgi:hypothetical protein
MQPAQGRGGPYADANTRARSTIGSSVIQRVVRAPRRSGPRAAWLHQQSLQDGGALIHRGGLGREAPGLVLAQAFRLGRRALDAALLPQVPHDSHRYIHPTEDGHVPQHDNPHSSQRAGDSTKPSGVGKIGVACRQKSPMPPRAVPSQNDWGTAPVTSSPARRLGARRAREAHCTARCDVGIRWHVVLRWGQRRPVRPHRHDGA